MGLTLHHLDEPEVRQHMSAGWEQEWRQLTASYARSRWPYGALLSSDGWQAYEEAMPIALSEEDDDWLLDQMLVPSFWLPYQMSHSKYGRPIAVDYDRHNAAQRLCFGEFNTAYVRGLAQLLVEQGRSECTVYRAGPAVEPRAVCTMHEGSVVRPQDVLANVRGNYFPVRRHVFCIPYGPNCHHSIRRTQAL